MKRYSFLLNTLDGASIPFVHTEYQGANPTLVKVSDVRTPGFKRPSRTKVIVNGRDLNDVCYRAELYSDGIMKAFCYRRNAAGHFYLDRDTYKVAEEVISGPGEFRDKET